MELEHEFKIESKEKRILKSESARNRRRERKDIAAEVLQREYSKNRKTRKNK